MIKTTKNACPTTVQLPINYCKKYNEIFTEKINLYLYCIYFVFIIIFLYIILYYIYINYNFVYNMIKVIEHFSIFGRKRRSSLGKYKVNLEL